MKREQSLLEQKKTRNTSTGASLVVATKQAICRPLLPSVQIGTLLTHSDYLLLFKVADNDSLVLGRHRQYSYKVFSYELLSKKGGNCLMIAENISLLIQVVMTVSLHGYWNP
jgi:hypothetical protein